MCAGGPPNPMQPIRPHSRSTVASGTRGAPGAAPTGFSILQFAERDLPDVVYVENLTCALYLDKQADVDQCLLAMERLSQLDRWESKRTTGNFGR